MKSFSWLNSHITHKFNEGYLFLIFTELILEKVIILKLSFLKTFNKSPNKYIYATRLINQFHFSDDE